GVRGERVERERARQHDDRAPRREISSAHRHEERRRVRAWWARAVGEDERLAIVRETAGGAVAYDQRHAVRAGDRGPAEDPSAAHPHGLDEGVSVTRYRDVADLAARSDDTVPAPGDPGRWP